MKLEDFSQQKLEMEDDYEGAVIATLLRSPKNTSGKTSVLYIHGYSDYFFHPHVAEALHTGGYNFYALDLRKYGRSLLPHQHPNYCRSMKEYFEELTASIQIILDENAGEGVILLGHSTGGLLASLYANDGKLRDHIEKIVLNSPFLEFNTNSFQRSFIVTFSRVFSFFFPFASRNKPLAHLYGQSLLKSARGEWELNQRWKPHRGFPAYLKWVAAVFKAQEYLRRHSDISCPILILHSSSSTYHRVWHHSLSSSDMVLNVEHMKEYGRKLGGKVTFIEVKNAIHDIFLSAKKVRERALNDLLKWLEG
ncbi:MAG: alpha/beta hydrolase [Balneolaceae bacterium]|nr:alpha/beta hydrolase [Balneolaceae bacterium]